MGSPSRAYQLDVANTFRIYGSLLSVFLSNTFFYFNIFERKKMKERNVKRKEQVHKSVARKNKNEKRELRHQLWNTKFEPLIITTWH